MDFDKTAPELPTEDGFDAVKEDACLLDPKKVKPSADGPPSAEELSAWSEVKESFKQDPAFWVILFMAGFMQGIQSLSGTATTYLLKDELNVSPAVSDSLGGFITIPWVIKPLWGFMSDTLPIFGSRRRAYLALGGFLGFLGLFLMATCPFTLANVAAFSLVSSIGTAIANTVTPTNSTQLTQSW